MAELIKSDHVRQEFFIQLRSLEGICGQIPLKLEPVEHPCHQSMDNAIARVELTFKSFVMVGEVFPAVNRITAARTGAELAYGEILERLGETEADIRAQADKAFRTFAKEHNQALAGIAGKARSGQVWSQFFLAGIVIERACVALIDDLILLIAEM